MRLEMQNSSWRNTLSEFHLLLLRHHLCAPSTFLAPRNRWAVRVQLPLVAYRHHSGHSVVLTTLVVQRDGSSVLLALYLHFHRDGWSSDIVVSFAPPILRAKINDSEVLAIRRRILDHHASGDRPFQLKVKKRLHVIELGKLLVWLRKQEYLKQ